MKRVSKEHINTVVEKYLKSRNYVSDITMPCVEAPVTIFTALESVYRWDSRYRVNHCSIVCHLVS